MFHRIFVTLHLLDCQIFLRENILTNVTIKFIGNDLNTMKSY